MRPLLFINLFRYINSIRYQQKYPVLVVIGMGFLFVSGGVSLPLYAQESKAPLKATEPAQQKKPAEQKKKPLALKNATRVEEKLAALDNLFVPSHWTDPATGLAIGGFDPIAYVEFSKPKVGDEEYEYVWHGVSWRFMNQGNLSAFKRSPSKYAPVYAGYDAYALSQGGLSIGYPSLWAIYEGRLYLFHNGVNRYLWLENAKKLNQKVSENWKSLSLDLPRYKIRK